VAAAGAIRISLLAVIYDEYDGTVALGCRPAGRFERFVAEGAPMRSGRGLSVMAVAALAAAALAALPSTHARAATVFITTLSGATEPPPATHTPYAAIRPGRDAVDQAGPSVHPLDTDFGLPGGEGSASGPWASDDGSSPPTGAPIDSLLDGELYFNLRSLDLDNGELRGQLQPLDATSDPGNGTAIPLPPALLAGLAGLGAAGWSLRRQRVRQT
jgi:hypothetical protein